jgi:hypothetical protein
MHCKGERILQVFVFAESMFWILSATSRQHWLQTIMGVESWEKFVQTSMATDPTIRSRHRNGKKKREKRLVLRYLRHSVVQQLRTPSNAASGTAASN